MDYTQIISTLGFPIAACVGMAMYIIFKDKQFTMMVNQFTSTIDTLTKTFNANNKELTDSINNNTIAITRLVEKLGGQ